MTESVDNERTPLIRRESEVPRTSLKRTYHVYGVTLSFLFLFSLFVHWFRAILPTPLSDIQASKLDDFAGIHAYNEYLSHFEAPHSANTRENGVMKDWIVSVVTGLQQGADHVKIDIIGNDTSADVISHDWFTNNEKWVVDSRNVLVRLHGFAGNQEALLINAHYDSVPTSNGVTDNGMGVVTALETLRYFIAHPPRQTIIFLFNNLEEGGLIGAQSFVKHPWFSSVKLFINLEGAGAGGRAILFRSSNLNAVKKLAYSSASFKHGSPLGNDIFRLKLIKSDTDYTIFTQHGVPGLDLAFYSPRSHYHTPRDDLVHTTPSALQHMGQMVLGAVKSIANSDDLLDTTSEQEPMVLYDILGRFMLAYSFKVYQFLNVLSLLVVPLTSFAVVWYKHQGATEALKQQAMTILYGSAAVFAALIISLVSVGLAAMAMTKINPSMTYGDVYGAALYLFSAAFLGLQLSQFILPAQVQEVLKSTDASWYGLIVFWWMYVVAAFYLATKEIAAFYYAFYLLAFSSLALLIHTHLPADKKFRSPVIFFTQTIVPFILLLEYEYLSMDSMRHATADGTPELAVYVLLSLPILLITLHFIPWLYVAGNQKKALMGSTIAFILLFTICSALQPFNGSWSPNKLLFRQEYTAGNSLATVTLSTATGLAGILKEALPPHEFKTLECNPLSAYLTKCTYQTDMLPKYGSNLTLHEFVHTNPSKHCDQTHCIATTTFSSKHSLMCRVQLDMNTTRIHHLWVNDQEVKSENITSVVTYSNEYEREMRFSVEYPADAPSPKATLGCFYDEWTRSEIPAFTTLRDNLPENALLLIRGQGLAFVNYANITL
ncbi:Vacuolar membrane protease [Choanephora cucurbitarum]|uniref:Peptide hydrolase n=1 Tax=Choanephora cucurbitarum TaxID=101091 RepID=A0A1C7NI78_9FUNG|nr:Vacuolar membrane protease [Choanephora cucurbitarum]